MRSELTDARDRESSKSITQGTYQEDGPSDDDRRSMRNCALECVVHIGHDLDRHALEVSLVDPLGPRP